LRKIENAKAEMGAKDKRRFYFFEPFWAHYVSKFSTILKYNSIAIN
jgi:hypothetical protein